MSEEKDSKPKYKYFFDTKRIRETLFSFVEIEGIKPEIPSYEQMLKLHNSVRSFWQECSSHAINLGRYYTTLNVLLLTAIGYLWLNYGKCQLLLILLAAFVGIAVCCQWLLDRRNIEKEATTSRVICDALEKEIKCRVVETEKYVLSEIDKEDDWRIKLLVRLDKVFHFPILLLIAYSLIIVVIIACWIFSLFGFFAL